MRIGDWSSDVCSSDLIIETAAKILPVAAHRQRRHPDRAAEIEGEHLAGLIAAELNGDQPEQHRFTGAGRSDDQGMADVAAMQREAERRRSLGLGEKQRRRVQMITALPAAPDPRPREKSGKAWGGDRESEKEKT